MEENRLQMNNNKTEFIFFCTRHQLDKCSTTAISACNVSVPVSKQVKYLGVYLDSELSLNTHVYNEKMSSSYDECAYTSEYPLRLDN